MCLRLSSEPCPCSCPLSAILAQNATVWHLIGHKEVQHRTPSTGKRRSGGVCPDWAATYMYFISTSSASVPPGALYSRLNIGDMSAWRIDWRISMTVARWTSYRWRSHKSALFPLCVLVRGRERSVPVAGSPMPKRRARWLQRHQEWRDMEGSDPQTRSWTLLPGLR
jgi:hypothetical protein